MLRPCIISDGEYAIDGGERVRGSRWREPVRTGCCPCGCAVGGTVPDDRAEPVGVGQAWCIAGVGDRSGGITGAGGRIPPRVIPTSPMAGGSIGWETGTVNPSPSARARRSIGSWWSRSAMSGPGKAMTTCCCPPCHSPDGPRPPGGLLRGPHQSNGARVGDGCTWRTPRRSRRCLPSRRS
jgi:hypothetical protein